MAFLSKKLLLQSQYRFTNFSTNTPDVGRIAVPVGVYFLSCVGGGGQGGFNDESGEVLGGAGGYGETKRAQIVVTKPTVLIYYVGVGGSSNYPGNGGAAGAAGDAGFAYAGGAGGAGGMPSWWYWGTNARRIRLATFTASDGSVTVYAYPTYALNANDNITVYYSDPATGPAISVVATYQGNETIKLPDGNIVYRNFNYDILWPVGYDYDTLSANGGGGGGGAGGQGRFVNGGALGSGGGGGGGFCSLDLATRSRINIPGKPGANGNNTTVNAGTAGNTTYFPNITSGAGTSGYRAGGGAGASGGGASGGGGGVGKLTDGSGWKRRGGGGGGGAGGSYSAGGGGGGKGINDTPGNNAYNYYTTPIATRNGYGQGGAAGGANGNAGQISIIKMA